MLAAAWDQFVGNVMRGEGGLHQVTHLFFCQYLSSVYSLVNHIYYRFFEIWVSWFQTSSTLRSPFKSFPGKPGVNNIKL